MGRVEFNRVCRERRIQPLVVVDDPRAHDGPNSSPTYGFVQILREVAQTASTIARGRFAKVEQDHEPYKARASSMDRYPELVIARLDRMRPAR